MKGARHDLIQCPECGKWRSASGLLSHLNFKHSELGERRRRRLGQQGQVELQRQRIDGGKRQWVREVRSEYGF